MSNSALTPGRTLSVTYDVPETVLLEDAWAAGRKAAEIAPGPDGSTRVGVWQWASGCYTLFPVQKNLHLLRERTNGLVIPQANWSLLTYLTAAAATAIPALVAVDQWKQDGTIPLVTYSGGVQATGDPFLTKRIQGATSYAPPSDALDLPPADTSNVVMDRCGVSTITFPADEAFCFRWFCPGGPHEHPDGIVSFYFGQYALYLDGSGRAHLWENPTQASGAANWLLRESWQYCLPTQVANVEHCLLAFPHKGPHGESLIDFSGNALDVAAPAGGAASPDAPRSALGDKVYRAGPLAYFAVPDPAPGHVTMPAPVRYDTRRDLRVRVQISRLGYSTRGTIQDYPAALPEQTSAQAVTVAMDARIPSTCTLTSQVKDAAAGGNFLPGTTTQPYVQFTFTGDGHSSAVLWGYTLSRPEVTATQTPGAFTGGTNRRLSLTGSSDVQQEAGSLSVSDTSAVLTRLATRGLLSCKIQTTLLDHAGATQTSTILRGYVSRPTSTKRGKLYKSGAHYPSADWRDFNAPLTGMWVRLASRVQDTSFRKYWIDPAAPTDPVASTVPWKVTDAVRDLIYSCGFSSAYVNIPDLPFRLWPTHDARSDVNTVMPRTTLADVIQRMVRMYLGAYLTFDANAGADGQWTLLFAPLPNAGGDYAPVFNFVTAPSDYATNVQHRLAPHRPGVYPADTAPIIGSWGWQNVPPEYNCVLVVGRAAIDASGTQGRICNWAYNPLSYSVPGFTPQPDPDHQDYLPWGCRTCIVVDMSLGGAGVGVQAVQRSVDWTCRRVFDYVAHGQKIARIRAPYSFVKDAATGNWRPLRALDPVSINGVARYVVKGVEPSIQRGVSQYATYEVIAPNRSQYIRGLSSQDFYRRAQDEHSRQATGHVTQSHAHALKSVTPASEQEILSLPDFGVFRSPLQDPATGNFFYLAGYDPAP